MPLPLRLLPLALLGAGTHSPHQPEGGERRARAAPAAAWKNLTLFHVNEKRFLPLGVTNMNEGDAAGDMFFAIKSRALAVECPGAYDCHDPEMYAGNLVVTKVVVEIDEAYLRSSGVYAECNVPPAGHGQKRIYTCLCRSHGGHGQCNSTIGVQDVRTLPWNRRPSAGASKYNFWKYNLAQKIGGQWWSTVGSRPGVVGECTGGRGVPAGCTWRLAETVKSVNKTCHDKSMNRAIVKAGSGCFRQCPQPTNTTSACWVDCFYKTVLGPKGGAMALANTSHAADGLSLSSLLELWNTPFDQDSGAQGGCPGLQ